MTKERGPEQLRAMRNRVLDLLRDNEIIPHDWRDDPGRVSFFEQGIMDSMGLFHTIELLKQEFGVEIDSSLFLAELGTIDAVCNYLYERGAAPPAICDRDSKPFQGS